MAPGNEHRGLVLGNAVAAVARGGWTRVRSTKAEDSSSATPSLTLCVDYSAHSCHRARDNARLRDA